MGKKKILYYTDCPFFAGCENMIANFFNSEELSKVYDIVLVYRYSKRYEEGAKMRMNLDKAIPVKLVVEPDSVDIVKSENKVISTIQKIYWFLLLWITKYYSVPRNAKVLTRVFREINPDIIHINNGGYPAATSCFAAVKAAKACGIKHVVYMVNNMAMNYSHPLRWFDRGLDRVVKKTVSYFITGSNNAGKRLEEAIAVPADKRRVIRNGITPRKATMSTSSFKKLYNIPEDKLVFSEIANLEERKGHRVLLQAIKRLRERGEANNVHYVLEGTGPLKTEIEAYIQDNQLNDIVSLIQVKAIYDLYQATDVLILPSIHTEDFPNTIIEAMGQGIPAIGTRIAGIPEQIMDHQNGILIDPSDVEQLAVAIKEMADNNELRESCSRNAKETFESNYTAEISVRNYSKLYESLYK